MSEEARVILASPPGAGKTDLAISALISGAGPEGPLPILVTASPDGSIEDWVQETFESVRFAPGPDLTRQYLRDGRIAITVDGIDDLAPDDRDLAIRELRRASNRYPRPPFVVLSRFAAVPLPPRFRPYSVSRLADEELDRLFAAVGAGHVRTASVGQGMLDLMRLPFWAALIASFGSNVSSPLGLLEHLIHRQIAEGKNVDAVADARIRAIFGALAYAIRPRDRTPAGNALAVLGDWLQGTTGRPRFGNWTADTLIKSGRRAGLVSFDGPDVRFPHPMIAAYLAAEHAIREGTLPEGHADDDFGAFIAALAGEGDSPLAREALGRSSIFAVAQFVRLGAKRQGAGDPAEDIARLDAMVRRLSAKAAGGLPTECHVSVLRCNGYLCVTASDALEVPELVDDMEPGPWLHPQGADHAIAMCWKGDPFESAMPERLAGEVVISAFKRAWRELRPEGHEYGPFGADIKPLLVDPDLEQRLLSFVLRKREARLLLLDRVGLRGSRLDTTDGDPSITLTIGAEDGRFTVEWGAPAPAIHSSRGEHGFGRSIGVLHADSVAVAFAELEDDVKSALGSAIFSQADRKPSEPWSI